MKNRTSTFSLDRRALLGGASALALGALLPRGAVAQAATGAEELITPEELRADEAKRRLDVVIDAVYGYYRLAGRPVSLRSYDGTPRPRTLRIRAGDTLGLTLNNRFPAGPAAAALPPGSGPTPAGLGGHVHPVAMVPGISGTNVPHGFNNTNMHVHGMHVSPRSPADNVLLTATPGQSLVYSYAVGPDHPCGLNFYHAHEHGSVALQVASGMAGALIVEGKVDAIEPIKAARDVVMLLQSLPVDAGGQLESYATLDNGTQVYINGQRTPTISMAPGEVQRWRLVNATHDRFLTLTLKEHGFVALGFDGNPLQATERMGAFFLAPGNRAEVLVKASERAGDYTLDGGSNFGVSYGPIATVRVGGPKADMTKANMRLYEGPLVDYARDFGGHLKPIGDGEIVQGRHVGFGQVGTLPNWTWTIDGKPFSATDAPFSAKLNTAEEWLLVNQTNDPHPFHIHINPFQVLEADGLPIPYPKNRWLDTIAIPPHGKVRLRTRYLDYDGTFVFHCHTLVHEDQGMMRIITVEG